MVGKSTFGSAETESRRKPNTPNAMIDAVNSVVITGRRMQSSDSPTGLCSCLAGADFDRRAIGEQQLPVDHDRLAASQSRRNHRPSAAGPVDGDRLGHRLAVL